MPRIACLPRLHPGWQRSDGDRLVKRGGMDRDALPLDWIAADWGSSQRRLWALDAEDRPLAQQSLPQGMARLTPDQFEPTVLTGQALVDLGMVGRGGLGVTG